MASYTACKDSVSNDPSNNVEADRWDSRILSLLIDRVGKFLDIRKHYYRFGRFVGSYPRCFLLGSMLLSLTTYGMNRINFRDVIREGYTALNARSRYETQALREFLNMRSHDINEVMKLKKQLRDLVGLEKKHYYDVNYRSALKNRYYSDLFNLSYPLASVYGYRLPIEQCLYGVKLVDRSKSTNNTRVKRFLFDDNEIEVNLSLPIESQITNMEHVSLIALFLYGNKNTSQKQLALTQWELGMHEYTKRYNKGEINQSSLVEVLVQSNEILNMEITMDNRKMSPYFSGGFILMLSIVIICVLFDSCYHNTLDFGKIIVGIAAILCPLLGITTTFGLLTIFFTNLNSLVMVMPFLIMGVGHVYKECGPSITISSMTNVLSFGIGAVTPTPEIRLFCYATATAILMTYIFHHFLFGPALAIATAYEGPILYDDDVDDFNETNWRDTVNNLLLSCLNIHKIIIQRYDTAVLILIMTIFYWAFALYGIFTMEIRLNSGKILSKDSYLKRPDSLLTSIVWKEHLSPIFLVDTYFDISDKNTTNKFWDLLKELESLPRCKGPPSSHVWLRAFAQKYNKTNSNYPYNVTLYPGRLPSFLKYDKQHFDMTLRYKNDSGRIIVERFLFMLSFTNVTDWSVRIELMTQWRNVISNFITYFMYTMKKESHTSALTVVMMTLLCAIIMRNLVIILTAAASMTSISIGVIGTMSNIGFDLDPVVMVSLLMTIGMSVDYIAHVAYHTQVNFKSVLSETGISRASIIEVTDKVENVVRSVALPMLQSGISTIVCVLPLLFLPTYSSSVFVTAIILVVILGLAHGLLILPTLFTHLPNRVHKSSLCLRRRRNSREISDDSTSTLEGSD
ncbi:putative ATP synthase F0, A subunit [Dictyocaulus viviparus]|uniref:Putative ATP synthase F0, A subunit n=1 Tax=Dictyocaulus viviparus TaxID=29172 RepID=A0A0D8XF00_DICVI|nr:putative ATP synthase F0, A subunit [Dictyocaulus viviparus]